VDNVLLLICASSAFDLAPPLDPINPSSNPNSHVIEIN